MKPESAEIVSSRGTGVTLLSTAVLSVALVLMLLFIAAMTGLVSWWF